MRRKAIFILFPLLLCCVGARLSAQNIWTGVASNWNNLANWSLGHVPGTGAWVGENISIQNATDVVTLDIAASVGDFSLSSTARIVSGGPVTLTIAGNCAITTTNAAGFDVNIPVTMSGAGMGLSSSRSLGNLTITGTITMGSAITVTGNLALTSGSLTTVANALGVAGNITQAGGTLTSTGTVTLNGTVAQGVNFSTSTLNNLTVNNTSGLNPAVTLTAAVTVGATFTHTAGTIALNGNGLTVNGGASLGATIGNVGAAGNVSVALATTLTAATSITTNNGNITFSSTVDGAFALSLTAGTGAVTVTGVVGTSAASASRLASFTVVSAASVGLSSVFTTGAQSVTGTGITLNGPTYQSTTAAAAIGYVGAVSLGGAVAVTTNNGNVSFSSTVNGAFALSLTAGTGAVTVTGVVGTSAASASRLASFTVVSAASVGLSSVFTTGAQSVTGTGITLNGPTYQSTTAAAAIGYVGAVSLGGAVAVTTNNGNVSFSSTVNGAFALSLTAGTGAVTVTGVVGTSAASASRLASFTVVSAASVGLSSVFTTGAQSVTGTGITLNGPTYQSTTAAAAIGYVGAVSLGGAVAVTTNNGNVSFSSTVNGAFALSLTAGTGAVTVTGVVGTSAASASRLASFTVVSAASVGLSSVFTTGAQSVTGTGITLNGPTYQSTTAAAAIGYVGAVSLGGAVAVTTNNGNVSFSSTVNGAFALSLTAGTGAVTVTGVVGTSAASASRLASFTVVSAASVGLSSVFTTGAQSVTGTGITLNGPTYQSTTAAAAIGYVGAVSLGGAVAVTTNNGNVSFSSTVNGAFALSLTAGTGAVTVTGVVGTSAASASRLASFTVVSAASVGLSSVFTTGAQSVTGTGITLNGPTYQSTTAAAAIGYVGAVSLGGAVAVTTNNGNVSFSSTVNGAFALSLTAGTGAVTVTGVVGTSAASASRLASFTVVSAASVGLSSVFTTGAQSVTGTGITLNGPTYQSTTAAAAIGYVGAVSLGGAVAVTTNNGNVSFSSTVNGAFALSLTAGTGAVTVTGVVGTSAASASRLASFTVVSAASVGLSSVFTTGAQSVTGTGITLNGPTYQSTTAAAAIGYVGAVSLGGAVAVTTNNGNVSFSSTVDGTVAGAQGLSVTAGAGNANLNGVVGGVTALASLTVGGSTIATAGIGGGAEGVTGATGLTATTAITFTGATYTANAQSYDAGAAANNLNMNAGATTTFTSSADAISFVGTVRLSAGTNFVVNTANGTLTVGSVRGTAGETVSLNVGTGLLTVSAAIGSGVEIGDVTFRSNDIALGGAVTSVGIVSFYTATGAVTMGVGGGAGVYQLSDAEVGNVVAATLVRIGENTVQSGLITVQTASFGAGVGGLDVNSNSGAGGVALDDFGVGTALALGSAGALTVRAGTVGVTASAATGANAELGTAGGGSVVISSVGAVGTAANRVQFAAGQANVSVTVTGAGSGAYLNGVSILTLGAITTSNGVVNVTTQAGALTIGALVSTGGGAASFDTGGGATINLNANVATVNGAISFADPVVLGTDSTLTSTGGITFSSTVDALAAGAQFLNLTGGAVIVTGPVGAVTGLSALTVSGTNVTVGSIGGAAEGVTGATGLTASTAMTLSGTTYRANAQSYTSIAGYTITLSAGAAVSFISSDDAISFVTAGVKLGNGSDLSVVSNGGAISLLGGVDGTSSEDVSLVSAGGTTNTVSVGPIGVVTADGVNTVGLQGTTSVTLNGNITTSNLAGNDVTVTGPCLLGAGVIVTTDTAGADGNITFTSTIDNAQALTLAAGTGNVNLNGAVGGTTRLGVLTVSSVATLSAAGISASSIVQSAGSVASTFGGALNTNTIAGIALTGTAITINSTVTTTVNGVMTVSNGGLLTVAAAGDMTLDGAFTQNGAGLVTTAGDITTTADAISFLRAVTLSGAVALNSAGGAISFSSTVDGTVAGAQNLNLTAGAGNITFTGAVGGTTRLGVLTVSSVATLSAAGISASSIVQSAGSVASTFGGALNTNTIAGIALTGTAITINSTVTTTVNGVMTVSNGGLLTVAAAGDMALDGAFTQNGAGLVTTAGDITTTADAISFLRAVTLSGAVALNSAGGAISFSSTVDGTVAGAQGLSVTAGAGNANLNGVVGGVTALASLTVGGSTIATAGIGGGAEGVTGATGLTATTAITFTGATYTANAQSYDAGAAANNLNMNAGATTTFTSSADAISFVGTVRLSAGTNFVVNTANGTLTVGSVRGTAGETVSLNVGTGLLTVSAAIGSGVEIGDVTFRSNDIALGGAVTSVGIVSFYTATGAVTMGVGGGAGVYQLSDAEVGNVVAATLVRIGENTVQSGLITVQTASFGAGVGGLDVNSNSGAGGVALDDFGVGTALALGSAGALTVRAGTVGVTASAATGANAELGTAGGGSVVISSVGAVGTAANRVQFAAGQANVSVTVTGAGSGAYLNGVSILTLGAITTSNGVVNVTTQAGALTIGALVSTGGGAASFDTGGGATINLNANVATVNGAISFADPVVLGTDSTLTSTGGITFSSTVDALAAGAQFLNLTGGAVIVTGPVGAVTGLSALTVSGTNVTVGGIGGAGAGVTGATGLTASTAMTLSGTTYRANAQSYTSIAGYTITLSAGAAVSFISSDDAISFVTAGLKLGNNSDLSVVSNGGAITVLGGVDGTSSEDVSLVSAGGTTNTVSVGPIGVVTANGVNTVGLQGTTSVTLNGNITTSNLAGNDVTVTGPCLLAAGVVVTTDTAGADGNITFTSTIDNAQALSLAAGTGLIDLQGVVGGAALSSLTVTSAATARFGANVTTTGAQSITGTTIQTNGTHLATNTNITFTGNVTLQAATSWDTGAGAGNITVTGTVNGPQTLSLTAGTGNTNLQGAVGGGTALTSLTVVSATTARFGGNVTSSGAQSVTATTIQTNGTHQTTNNSITFNGNMTLQANTTASAGNAAVDFNGTVDGGFGLIANTTGVTTFVGNVGGTTLLASVTTNAGGSVNLPALVQTTGNQTYNDAVILVANTVLVGATSTFASTVTGGGFDFTLSFTVSTTIDGAVITGVKNLLSDSGGTTTLTGNITTTGPQSYVDAVVVSGPGATLVSGGTNIGFSSTVNGTAAGTQSLTINAGAANASFGGIVGAPTSLASLSVTAAGLITIRNVTTTGAQSFTGPVSLGAAATLTTAGGNIAFSSTVDGATFNLALVSHAGTTTATGNLTNVGMLTLQDNTAPSTGATIFNGSVQATSLATWARGYEIRFNAGGTVTNNHVFANTGNLRVASGFTFTGGATKTAGTKFLSGIVQSTNSAIDFNTTPVTMTGNTTISTGAGSISLGAVTGAFSLALTTSVSSTLESMVDVGATLDLSAVTGGTVTVTGALTVQALTTAATAANIALNGGGTVQNAVTFNNTGSLTITNGFIFANGVLPPGGAYPSLTSLAGPVSATAGTLDFGNTAVTANCTLSAPGLTSIHTDLSLSAGTLTLGGALRVYGAVSIPAGTTLNDSGSFTITIDGNWSNTGGTFTSGLGTVVFGGAVDQTVNPGSSSFNNLTKQGGSRLSLLVNDLTVTGTLTIAAAADSVDVASRNFTINTLTNNGTFRLDGTQATQTITTMTMILGTVQYYDGAANGTIGLSIFYTLDIFGPARTFTLGQDITVGPAAGGGELRITGGSLDVSASDYFITLRGDWLNMAGDANFVARSGTVFFVRPSGGTTFIYGDNTWFVFNCQTPNVTIRFEDNKRQTIKNSVGATFRVKTTVGNSILLTNVTGTAVHWHFTLNPLAALDMAYVTVDWSWAEPYDVPVPPNVNLTPPAPVRCPGWKNINDVLFSGTVDFDQNGKIDRILVTTQFNLTRSAAAFSGFVVQVAGYALTTVGGSAGSPYNWTDPVFVGQDDEFWIMLEEKPYLDTGVQPDWSILSNSTLNDSAVGDKYVPVGTLTPNDTAPPVIGYTLSAADRNEVFVHFSEPVRFDLDGTAVTTHALQVGDFTYSGAAVITGVTRVTTDGADGTSEALLTLNSAITATEAVTPANISVTTPGTIRDKNPLDPGNLRRPFILHWPLVNDTHRVSDVGLGLVGDGVMEPVWAHDQTTAPQTTTGVGRINLFDGTKWLRDQDITLTGHVHNNIVLDPSTRLWFDVGVDASLKSASGLWLPPFISSTYNGVVPFPNSSARPLTGTAIGTQVREYLIPGSDSEIVDGARIEFLFQVLAGGAITRDLFCARLTDPAASDWYRRVVPWAFDVHEIKAQKGNVSILNNVINPNLGQTVTLQYVQPTIGSVTISVFDLAGNLVKVLTRVSGQAAGDYAVTWDGKNTGGRSVARGIYFIRIVAPGIDEMRKVLVVR